MYKQKKMVKNLAFFLLFVIAFCSWIKGFMITRAIENMAKEMRYDIFYNYIVGLEKTRIYQKININLANVFANSNPKKIKSTNSVSNFFSQKKDTLQFMKIDNFSITDVDEHVETIMIDLKKTAT